MSTDPYELGARMLQVLTDGRERLNAEKRKQHEALKRAVGEQLARDILANRPKWDALAASLAHFNARMYKLHARL